MLHGLSRTEAVREYFCGFAFIYSIVTLLIYFLVNFIACIWVLKNRKQLYCWSAFIGVYIGVMFLPSYTSQKLSEYLEAHLPKVIGIMGDLFILIGLPLLIAYAIRKIGEWVCMSHKKGL
jgi:hypothetical protein